MIIKNINVIPMTEDIVIHNQIVLIENGKIKAISNACEGDLPDDDVIIDGTNKYLIPGLFDMHVHLNSSDMMDLLFANGVTGIRNMWGFSKHIEWREKIKNGNMIGPYIYTTGPLTDGNTYWEGSTIVTTVEEAQKIVNDCIEIGYDFVKTYSSIPRNAFIKIMEVANEKGIKVIGHGNSFVSFEELAKLGYYSLEHTNQMPKNEEDIRIIAEAGMWICPTLTVVKPIYDYIYHSHLNMDMTKIPNYEYLIPAYQNVWSELTKMRCADPKHLNPSKDIEDENNKVRLFRKYSDRIIAGTDTPNPAVVPGFSLHDELYYMVKYFGMTPFEALKTATVNACKCLQIENQKGTLAVNMDADMLILNKNPLDDISNTRELYGIIQGGRYTNRNEIDDIMDKVKNIKEENIEFIE